MKLHVSILLALVVFVASGRADVVNLKNGDRVTGTLVTIKGGTLTLKSDVMGNVTIPMAKVASYSMANPVALVSKGKEPIQGTVALTPAGDYQVTANGQTQNVKPATVDTVMPAEAYEKLVEVPPIWKAWKGSATLGESIQRGNQDTNTLTTTIAAVRERPALPIFQPNFRTTFGSTALISHANEDDSNVTSHTFSSNVREDFLFRPTLFVFAMGQLDHISTEALYLRQTAGGGFGKDVIKNSRTTFSLLGGVTYQHEKFFTGSFDSNASGLFGETLGEQFTKRIRLDHSLTFYPNFSEGGQYRFDTTSVVSIKLWNKFAFNTNLIDLYLSNPPVGNQKNDVTFSTGIGYSF